MMLTTPRLILRDFEPDDWSACHEYASQLEVVTYMGWGPNDEQATRDFVARCVAHAQETPRTDWELAVVLRDENCLIGGCDLGIQGGMGYCFNPAYWGRGYATEAAGALLRLGFQTCGLHRIFATADVRNVGSWRVMEKLGMRREGHLRQHTFERGEWRDSFLYAILENEWSRQLCKTPSC